MGASGKPAGFRCGGTDCKLSHTRSTMCEVCGLAGRCDEKSVRVSSRNLFTQSHIYSVNEEHYPQR